MDVEQIEEPRKEPGRFSKALKYIQNNLMVTTNGMAIGLFGTLIIGTILALFAQIPHMEAIGDWADTIKGLMGAGIGLGVGLSKKKQGVALVACLVAGAIGNYAFDFSSGAVNLISDPLSCYVAVIICLLVLKFWNKRKTPVDLILIPLVGIGASVLYSFLLAAYVHYITVGLGLLVELCFRNVVVSFFMCIFVSVIVGMVLTAPISSVALCVAISIGNVPMAAAAALIGCCTQMVGFAAEAAYDNKWGSVIAIGIGTSMLEFKNIVRKPLIWLPTCIASAILGPFAMLFPLTGELSESLLSVGAGMGTSGLVGPLNFLGATGYSWQLALWIIGICVLAPIALTLAIDFLFRKLGWIKKGDFSLSNDIAA